MKTIEKQISEIYRLSIELWFDVADNRMKSCGHPGVMGPSSNEDFSPEYGRLMGAVQALNEVVEKLYTDHESILEQMDISIIERYLRKNKLNKINYES